jgi:ankyrin repeat protein
VKRWLSVAIGLLALIGFAAGASAADYGGNPAQAARDNDAGAVRQILAGGDSNPNQTDEQSRTALHYAAINGSLEIVAILIKSGARLDVTDPLGNTPLHLAADNNRTEAAELLLAAGAEVDAQNHDGMTALMIAAGHGNTKLALDLVARGASTTITDYTGRDAMAWAEETHHPAVVNALKRVAGAGR